MRLVNVLHWIVRKILPRPRERFTFIPDIDFYSGLGDGAWFLYGLVRLLRPAVCVEIGSARGKSACYIGLALRQMKHGRLYAIDPHAKTAWNDSLSVDTFEAMRRNLEAFGVQDYVDVIRKYSDDVAAGWNRPIDLLFIDGDHSYEGVKQDWSLFVPHVTKFGVVIFHDTAWGLASSSSQVRADMGVPTFVEELRTSGYPVITINRCCGISIVQPVRSGNCLSGCSLPGSGIVED